MSDAEEPPPKVSKYELSQTFTQPDELDEGQEEWLSEDMLTDDDCNATADAERSDSAVGTASQDVSSKADDSNIEQTLNSLENHQQDDLPSDLDEFLIRKTKTTTDAPRAKEESDGNDTDDLLRMLGDDEKVKKKTKKIERKGSATTASSDEDDEYEKKNLTKVKIAKNILQKKQPSMAVPEDTSATDASADEAAPVNKVETRKRQGNYAAKSTSKPQVRQANVKVLKLPDSIVVKKHKPPVETNKQHPTVPKGGTPGKPPYKPQPPKYTSPAPDKQRAAMSGERSGGKVKVARSLLKPPVKVQTKTVMKPEPEPESEQDSDNDEIIDEEEFAEEDDFDLDEDFAMSEEEVRERQSTKQVMMHPEQLDEEMLSDLETNSAESSMYGEFPSSESDEADDFFSLDLRDERAGDYLPLLGDQAYGLLLQEKNRSLGKLASLRESLEALTADGKKHAEKLRAANATLAEIEDALKLS